MSEPDSATTTPPPDRSDRYGGVAALMLAASFLGWVGAALGGFRLANKVVLDLGVTLEMATGVLAGVLVARFQRARAATGADDRSTPKSSPELPEESPPSAKEQPQESPSDGAEATEPASPSAAQVDAEATIIALAPEGVPLAKKPTLVKLTPSLITKLHRRIEHWLRGLDRAAIISVATGAVGLIATYRVITAPPAGNFITTRLAMIVAGLCLLAAVGAATAARYLGEIEPGQFPESQGLCRGARVVGWMLLFAAVSVGLEWFGQNALLGGLQFVVGAINIAGAVSLLWVRSAADDTLEVFPIDLGLLSMLGRRANPLASVLDSGERQLGIDLRSTWALTVIRRGLEPIVIGLLVLEWLSTSLTVVSVEERGLVERLGVASTAPPLDPGLHLHWPWPVDHVIRLPVQRVQSQEVGHEGEEAPGPENVLWAVEHAKNEFTLLLGNGRDLLVVDAAVAYRIVDSRAWHYHSQNPDTAMKALAYRAVMRNTVNLTLSDALSENVALLSERIRTMIQHDADALGLGVEVIRFTVGGMHPPVAVAASYQGVVSAEIKKVTAVVNAQAYHNEVLPLAEASVITRGNAAQAAAANDLARAAGEAWSFRALESQYHVSPEDYFFRRRLETLEQELAGRGFTVVDARFLRDGGVLWVNP